jgi:D-alanyl-D-alanine carboxypeptidase
MRTPIYTAGKRPIQEMSAQRVAFSPEPPSGRWAIQVGAFASLATAQTAAENARAVLPDLLRTAKVELPVTAPFGSQVAFRARLFGLTPSAATDACSRLGGRGIACITVPPSRDSF